MYHIFCIHSSVEGHLGSFQLLAIINKAAMNIVEHVSFLPVGTSSRYMPRRGIAGSSGSTMSNFVRNRQTDFQSGCTSLQSHQQWRSVPLSPHPLFIYLLITLEFIILIESYSEIHSHLLIDGLSPCRDFTVSQYSHDQFPHIPITWVLWVSVCSILVRIDLWLDPFYPPSSKPTEKYCNSPFTVPFFIESFQKCKLGHVTLCLKIHNSFWITTQILSMIPVITPELVSPAICHS